MTPDTVYLVEIDAYNPDTEEVEVLRFASGLGLVTSPSETPPNAHYAPLVTQPVNFTRTAFSDARVMGGSQLGYGEIRLNNADQQLSWMLDYGVDGRNVVVRIGPEGAPYPSGYTVMLTGTAEQIEADAEELVIRLRDRLAVLDTPFQKVQYAGTNTPPDGYEGSEDDIKGQDKPINYGRVFHVEPVCVNPHKQIYDLHSRPDGSAAVIQAVDAVYEGGLAVTFGVNRANQAAMDANEPDIGKWDSCLATGRIRFGYEPTGKITVNFRGEATTSYVNTVSGIVQRILEQCGETSIGSSSFSALASAAPYEVGISVQPGETARDVIERLLLSCSGWLVPDRLGVWQVGQLTAPSGTPVVVFTDLEIDALQRRSTDDAERGVPIHKAIVRYKKWQSPFSASEVVGAVDASTRASLVQEWRSTSPATSSATLAKHLLAGELKRDTCIVSETDANTERDRLLALHGVRRDFVEAEVETDAFVVTIDIGTLVELRTSRLDYASGRLFWVVGITSDGTKGSTKLDLWG